MFDNELKDYYRLLGLPQSATLSEIHKAYWKQACRCHPDKGGSHESMVQLVEAWRILSDPEKRSRYDQLLNFRPKGWRNRKFDADVQDARKRAENYATTWAEFEEIYQKAFYTFNQDFYGVDFDINAAGPYSPLFSPYHKEDTAHKTDIIPSRGATMFDYIFKTTIALVAVGFVTLWYCNQSSIGRFVLFSQGATVQLLNTSTGAVYTMEKKDGAMYSSWAKTVLPFSKQHAP